MPKHTPEQYQAHGDLGEEVVRLRAANEILLAALKGAQGALRKAMNAMDGNSGMFDAYDYCGEWLDDINDTISKAEGGE